MKRTGIMAALLTTALLFSTFGCGGAAIGNLTSINLTTPGGTNPNLKGAGGTLQLKASGIYSSTNTQDLSSRVTYVVTTIGTDDGGAPLPTPPNGITVSPNGLVTAVPPFICTWTNMGTSTTPSWFMTGSYQIVAQYKGISSNPVFIAVAAAASISDPNGQCGP